MVGENTLTTAAAMKIIRVAISTGFRPYLSLIGPRTISPNPRPIIPIVRPSCTVGTEQWKNSFIDGSEGIYMSFTNDPKALSPAR